MNAEERDALLALMPTAYIGRNHAATESPQTSLPSAVCHCAPQE